PIDGGKRVNHAARPSMRRIAMPLIAVLACGPACTSSSGSDGNASTADTGGIDAPNVVDSGSATDARVEGSVDAIADADADTNGSTDSTTDVGSAHVILRVHYPAGAHAIAIRGASGPWTWDKGVGTTSSATDTFVYETDAIAAPTEWKPLLDDATWSRGPNYVVRPGEAL